MDTTNRPLPSPTELTEPFWRAAREGRIDVQCCKACGTLQFYPREICTQCMSDGFDWKTCSGLGRVYTYTINHRAANAYMKGRTPYAVAVVELDEGVRLMGNIVDTDLDAIAIGARVQAVFEAVNDEITLIQYKVIADDAGSPVASA
ncbi:Zn-ribbon domain-containing OB-fold protein [Alcaligenaceae bacterium]|nr:Zn-ribbon domain-containing OB-fold protein [Alcaligenaceae bacterium]